jgi:hypothetical protein
MFAAQGGLLEIVKWAFAKKQVCSQTCEIACAHGHAEIFDWTLQNGCVSNAHVTKVACDSQHLYLARRAFAAQPSGVDHQTSARHLEWMGQDLEDVHTCNLADEQELNDMYALLNSIVDIVDEL